MDKNTSQELQPRSDGVELTIISDPSQILDSEVERVARYLKSYPNYKKNGYANFLRWPKDINPDDGYDSQKDIIKDFIVKEMDENRPLYESFEEEQLSAFKKIKEFRLDENATSLFGYKVQGKFVLRPTAYGTMSSPFNPIKGEPAYFRLKEFRQIPNMDNGKDRTVIETLVHELYAHSLTAIFRSGTLIDDYLNIGVAVNHKERLMDLIGRTLLVRSGLMKKTDIAMQDRGLGKAGKIANLVDSVYYADDAMDENKLRYEGKIGELVGNLVKVINSEKTL